MATLTIRNLPDDVRERLRVRAAQAGRSMEAEARAILGEALAAEREPDWRPLYELQRRVVACTSPEKRGNAVDEFLCDKRQENIAEMIMNGDEPELVFGDHYEEVLQEAGLTRASVEAMRRRIRELSS